MKTTNGKPASVTVHYTNDEAIFVLRALQARVAQYREHGERFKNDQAFNVAAECEETAMLYQGSVDKLVDAITEAKKAFDKIFE